MDIPGLKAELEEHLKRLSHADAPGGFRDRFEQAVEHHQAEHDPEDKSELEAQLHRIRDEAEAAANAASPGGRVVRKGRLSLAVGAIGAAAAAVFYFRSRR